MKNYFFSLKKFVVKKLALDVFDDILIEKIKSMVHIISAEETLEQITYFLINNKQGVYMRFGDGDIFLLKNVDDGFQKSNQLLSLEMEEALSLSGAGIFKCLAIHSDLFGYSDGMLKGNHKVSNFLAKKLLKDSCKFFVGSNIYSPVAFHFTATNEPLKANSFLKLLKQKTKIVVGNEFLSDKTKSVLFHKDVVHIKTPSKNAYNEIDRVEQETLSALENIQNFSVIVVAMGCSGRPFMKRIWKKNFNVFLFDFGSLLDGIEGNNTRTWLKINQIDYNLLLTDLDKV